MAASTASLELRNNTDANFRLWGNFISTGLSAGGWTKMDTDINWTTVNAPAQNNYAGYEVWRSPAETGLSYFYVKLRYGSHNNATVGPALEWTVAWGYAGTGSTLSGITTTAVSNLASTTAAASTSRTCTIAAGTGYIVINLGNGEASQCGFIIVIERNLDPDNAFAAADEVTCYSQHWTTSAQATWQTTTPTVAYVSSGTQSAASAQAVNCWLFPQNETAWPNLQSGSVRLFGLTGHKYGDRTTPLRSILACRTIASATPMLGTKGQSVSGVSIYGSTYTFKILDAPLANPIGVVYAPISGSATQFSMYLRYD